MRAYPTSRMPLHRGGQPTNQSMLNNASSLPTFNNNPEPVHYYMSQRDAFNIPVDFDYFESRCYEQISQFDFTTLAIQRPLNPTNQRNYPSSSSSIPFTNNNHYSQNNVQQQQSFSQPTTTTTTQNKPCNAVNISITPLKSMRRDMSIESAFDDVNQRSGISSKPFNQFNQQSQQKQPNQPTFKLFNTSNTTTKPMNVFNQLNQLAQQPLLAPKNGNLNEQNFHKNSVSIISSPNQEEYDYQSEKENSCNSSQVSKKAQFSTPDIQAQKRKNRKFCIIDSARNNGSEKIAAVSSIKRNNQHPKSVNNTQGYNANLQHIIHPSSSKRNPHRRSINSLHISFQKQLNNQPKASEELQSQSKKLRKLVKNKRRSNDRYNSQNDQADETPIAAQAESKNCAICLGIPEDSIYGAISCSHEFCLDCIAQWAQVTNQCPMCRKEFLEIITKDYNEPDIPSSKKSIESYGQKVIKVECKKQRISDDEEFYWEEASFLEEDALDEVCYICETDQDEEKLIICDHCGIRICHTYCDNDLFDDSVPSDDWFCHECRLRSELFD